MRVAEFVITTTMPSVRNRTVRLLGPLRTALFAAWLRLGVGEQFLCCLFHLFEQPALIARPVDCGLKFFAQFGEALEPLLLVQSQLAGLSQGHMILDGGPIGGSAKCDRKPPILYQKNQQTPYPLQLVARCNLGGSLRSKRIGRLPRGRSDDGDRYFSGFGGHLQT